MGTVFKVGDRVVVVEADYDYEYDEDIDYIGLVGMVTNVADPNSLPPVYVVTFDDGLTPLGYFFEDELELVTDVQEN